MAPSDYLRFLAALVFVLGLIALLAWLARRARLIGPTGTATRRLRTLEVLPLDARRKLVLIQHDGVEHLLLVGQDGNRLIESRPAPAGPMVDAAAGAVTAGPVTAGPAAGGAPG